MVRRGEIPSRRVDGVIAIPLRLLNALLRRVDHYRIPGMLPTNETPQAVEIGGRVTRIAAIALICCECSAQNGQRFATASAAT